MTTRPTDRELPRPEREGGLPLMQALAKRASCRRYADRPLTDQTLGNLLWAANGVNRPDAGRRTVPTACNWQELDLYVLLPEGAYRYDAAAHRLCGVAAGDLRPFGGVQPFVARAPVVLAVVANRAKMRGADEDGRRFYAPCDSGYVSQSLYLFAASEGLGTVALVSVDKPLLHQKLGLAADQEVVLTQPVGFPLD